MFLLLFTYNSQINCGGPSSRVECVACNSDTIRSSLTFVLDALISRWNVELGAVKLVWVLGKLYFKVGVRRRQLYFF